VVIYTALGGGERTAAAMAAGAADYLSKDLPPDELVTRVRSIALAGVTAPPALPKGPRRRTEMPPAPDAPRSRTDRPLVEAPSPRSGGRATPERDPDGRRAMTAGAVEDAPTTVGILADHPRRCARLAGAGV
jgi:hypothetical protein